MKIFKAYTTRLYPTKSQEVFFSKNFGACRWVYNHFLSMNIERYTNGEKKLSAFDMNYIITELKTKQETEWLKEVDSQSLKYSAANLDTAYKNFFSSVKGSRKGKSGFPKFKTRNSRQSYTTTIVKVKSKNKVTLPKIGIVKCRGLQEFTGTIKRGTVSRNPSGEYYISYSSYNSVSG